MKTILAFEGGYIYLLIPFWYLCILAASLLISLVLAFFWKTRNFSKRLFVGAIYSIGAFVLSVPINIGCVACVDFGIEIRDQLTNPFFLTLFSYQLTFLIFMPFVISLVCIGLAYYLGIRGAYLEIKRVRRDSIPGSKQLRVRGR